MTSSSGFSSLKNEFGAARGVREAPGKLLTLAAIFKKESDIATTGSILNTLETSVNGSFVDTIESRRRGLPDTNPLLSPDEITSKYPNITERYDTPQREKFLKVVNNRQQRRKLIDNVIARGEGNPENRSGWFSFAKVVATLYPHVFDPVNILSGHLIGAKTVLKALPKISKTVAGFVGASVGEIVVETTARNISRVSEGLDTRITEELAITALGGSILPFAAIGIKRLGKRFGNSFVNATKDISQQQGELGHIIDPSPIVDQAQKKEIALLKEKLKSSQKSGASKESIEKINQDIKELESNALNLNEQEVRRKANTDENGVIFNKEASRRADEAMQSSKPFKIFDSKETLDKTLKDLKDLEGLELLDGKAKKELSDLLLETENEALNFSDAFDLLSNCVLRS